MMWTILALAAAAAAATPAKPTTTQARFDAANAAATAQRCPEAVALYEALETASAIQRNPLARATIAVRKGACLIAIERTSGGETSIRSGLPTLEGKGAEFTADVRDARMALSRAAASRYDYDVAIAEADKALAVSTGYARVTPLMMLSVLTMFDGDRRAIAYADDARRTIAAEKGASNREVAAVQTQAARALLNAGRTKEAYQLLKDSLARQGGLSLKVTLLDIATRSDLAIAALLSGDKNGARQYLAYTGAGRTGPFSSAQTMRAPTCDPAIGLKPSDVAVVEFSIDDGGRVFAAQPIYVTGSRAAAMEFARAVAGWSWQAEAAKAIPVFFRTLARVEVRCSTGADVPDPEDAVIEAARLWFYGDTPPPWTDMSRAAAAPLERAALAAAKPGTRAELAALTELTANTTLLMDEKRGYADRAAAALAGSGAPAAVHAWIGLVRTRMQTKSAKDSRARVIALLADPIIAADPVSASVLRLSLVTAGFPTRSAESLALLDQVIDLPGLAEHHPLKVNALLHKSNLLAAKRDLAGADAAFRRTGLTAEQCAMLGVTPALRSSGASSDDFPQEAQRWGFGGWVRTEFDIAADGRTLQQRALIAYPPFVFNEAATGIAKKSRWTSSYRPDGSVACAASQMPVRFLMP